MRLFAEESKQESSSSVQDNDNSSQLNQHNMRVPLPKMTSKKVQRRGLERTESDQSVLIYGREQIPLKIKYLIADVRTYPLVDISMFFLGKGIVMRDYIQIERYKNNKRIEEFKFLANEFKVVFFSKEGHFQTLLLPLLKKIVSKIHQKPFKNTKMSSSILFHFSPKT